MASSYRRNLVSRARLNENGNSNLSPAQRRQRDENREPTPLPPYEPPSCALTANGRRALDDLGINHNYARYEKHIKESKRLLPIVVGDCSERLTRRREKIAKAAERRQRQGRGDDEKTELEREDEVFVTGYEKKAADVTNAAEKAMRDLIDYSDELAMQETLMKEVSEAITAAPVPGPRSARRPRQRRLVNDDSDGEAEEEEEVEESAAPGEVLSAVGLLNKAREDYTTTYTSKTMLERYENNDYRGFKRAVHEALNPGEDAPPLPRASKWFPQDRASKAPGSSSRRQTAAEDDEESDEDLYISGAKIEYKCPLSLLQLENPYTNTVCKHSYEKQFIIDYINTSGTYFASNQGRGARIGEKQIKCSVVGCDNMLKISDFYDDAEILRNIKRANKRAQYDMEEEEEDQPSRGTQRTRPEELDDESEGENQTRSISRVKRERQSQGINAAGLSDVEMDE